MLDASPAVSGDFNLYYNRKHLKRMRGAMISTMVLMVLFSGLDTITMPEKAYFDALKIRLLLLLPIAAIGWCATYIKILQPHLQWIIGFGALIVGTGVVYILWIGRAEQVLVPYEGLILVTIFFYFLVGLRFQGAMLCGWTICAVYTGMELYAGVVGENLFINVFFLVAANLIGSVGSYFQDAMSRENYDAEKLLSASAEKDFLTGLLNRRALDNHAPLIFRQAVREQRPVAVAMMDVDYFKAYNDFYGHAAGDEALKSIAHAIAECSQRPLDIVARYGGEEFAAVWFGLSRDKAADLAELVRSRVEDLAIAHEKSGLETKVVTISVGLVWLVPSEDQGVEACLRQADEALYEAKGTGRNRVMQAFGPQLNCRENAS